MSAAVAYIRVSSRAQTHDLQRHAIEKAVAARGDTIVEWYAEKASARTIDRPELARLRADARAGRVRRVYVYRLDRLSRSGIRDTLEVVEELQRHGAELVTLADGFDLAGPAAPVVLSVLSWASEMERRAINERISAARDRLEAEGKAWGRPARVDDALRARMAELRDQGRTVREIAVALKVPRSTVSRHLGVSRKVPGSELERAPS